MTQPSNIKNKILEKMLRLYNLIKKNWFESRKIYFDIRKKIIVNHIERYM